MARRKRPPDDDEMLLDAVFSFMARHRCQFDRAVRGVVDEHYADRYGVTVKPLRARVYRAVRRLQLPASALPTLATIRTTQHRLTPQPWHRTIEELVRIARFRRAFDDLLDPEIRLTELASLYREAHALIRKRKSRTRQ